MKKIYGFAFASAIMALASCSNENEPVNPNPGPDPVVDGGYMSFVISAPGLTRAEGDEEVVETEDPNKITTTGFENGKPFEQAAETATFLFFDSSQRMTQIPQTVQLTWTTESSDGTPNVEKISEGVVVVSGRDNGDSTTEPGKPVEVLVILNDPGVYNFTGLTKTQVLTALVDAENAVVTNLQYDGKAVECFPTSALAATTNSKLSGKFIMTNATYLSTTSEVKEGETDATVTKTAITATPLTYMDGTEVKSYIYSSRDEALKGKKVPIYVERLAARIDLKEVTGGLKPETTADFQVNNGENGIKMALTPVIEAVGIANIADQTNYFKEIKTTWEADLYDTSNMRANWSVMPSTANLLNKSYEDYTSKIGEVTFYVKENTTEFDKDAKICENTAVLVTAKLCAPGADGKLAPVSLVRWAGIYFTPEAFKTQGLNFLKGFTVNDVKMVDGKEVPFTRSLTADDLNFDYVSHAVTDQKQYETALKASWKNENVTYNIVDATGKAASLDDINAELAKANNRCWYWKDGQTYYYVAIKNATPSQPYGVVRNNIYRITLNSLKGLGVPVFDPKEEILPQTPEEDLFYVGAQINVLKWRLVEQNADFNQVPL